MMKMKRGSKVMEVKVKRGEGYPFIDLKELAKFLVRITLANVYYSNIKVGLCLAYN